jgi:hypothetical protein
MISGEERKEGEVKSGAVGKVHADGTGASDKRWPWEEEGTEAAETGRDSDDESAVQQLA